MSFLFTFSLPRLPFNNPFSTQNREQHASSEHQRYSGEYDDGNDVTRHSPSAFLDSRQYKDSQNSSVEPNYMGYGWKGNSRSQAPVVDTLVDNPRKRKKTDDNYHDIHASKDYAPQHSSRRHPLRARQSRNAASDFRTMRDVQFEYHNIPEAYSDEEEEGHRATKRRKLGIAETLLSTVISVAIVSTAVGYTAYKLWKDNGKTPDARIQEIEEAPTLPDDDKGKYTPRKRAMDGYPQEYPVSSPPPPYHVEDGSESGKEEYSRRRGSQYSQSSSVRPPMSHVHRTLGTSIGPGGKSRKTFDEEQFPPRAPLPDVGASQTMKQKTRMKTHSESEGDVTEERFHGIEELKASRGRIEQQMDSMSRRLQKLITDGNRALGRDARWILEAAEAVEHGTGYISNGESSAS